MPVTWAPLKVVTRSLTPGWLRRNGVPYSANATVTEYDLFHTDPGAGVRLTITTIVEDPTYLAQPFITSPDFKKEPDNSKWAPTPVQGLVRMRLPTGVCSRGWTAVPGRAERAKSSGG